MEELLERAKKFLKEAEDDIKKGFYDLCMFHLEQALQLLLKYVLAKEIGYFPTRSLTVLNEEVKKVAQRSPKFSKETGEYGSLLGIEIHLVAPEVFEKWYKKFLDVYEEV